MLLLSGKPPPREKLIDMGEIKECVDSLKIERDDLILREIKTVIIKSYDKGFASSADVMESIKTNYPTEWTALSYSDVKTFILNNAAEFRENGVDIDLIDYSNDTLVQLSWKI